MKRTKSRWRNIRKTNGFVTPLVSKRTMSKDRVTSSWVTKMIRRLRQKMMMMMCACPRASWTAHTILVRTMVTIASRRIKAECNGGTMSEMDSNSDVVLCAAAATKGEGHLQEEEGVAETAAAAAVIDGVEADEAGPHHAEAEAGVGL